MTHGKIFHFEICRLLILLSRAIGLSGCAARHLNQEADQVPTTNGPVRTARQARPGGEKPAQAPAPAKELIKEVMLEDIFKVQDLRIHEERGQTTVLIEFSEPVTQYRHFALTQPSRIVLEVFGDIKPQSQVETFHINTGSISKLRISYSEGYFRIVAGITAATVPAYVIEPQNGGLKVIIGPLDSKVTGKRDLQLVKGGKRVDVRVAQEKPRTREVSQARRPQVTPPEEKKYTGQRVSLDFKDADIKNVFRLLAEVSGLNIVVTDDVVKKVTVRLLDVPWDQAMDILLETNGLGKEQVGNVVRISTVERLRSEREAIRAAREAEKKLEPIQTTYLTVNYAKATEVVNKIKAAKVLSERGEAIADDRTNTILIRDIKMAVEEANDIASRFDTRTTQVLIESNLIETTPTFARALGVRFQFRRGGTTFSSAAGAGSPFTTAPGAPREVPTGLGLDISVIQEAAGGIRDLASVLEAAEAEGNIRIISRPSVVTLNNVPSTIQSLRIIRIALPSGTTNIASGTGSAAGAAVATETVNVGIILTVTPQVSSDGFVLMNISVKSSSIAESATSTAAGVIPFDELTREAISNVLVRDGETVVIGGIMKDTRQEREEGIPFLKDIPLLGWLFKNVRFQKDFEELMVFITPRIISAGSKDLPAAEQLWRDAMKKTEGDKPLIGPAIPD
ncbi:MAG: type IV pilus secretin PilQ [Candidatus Binatia bacterium]